MGVYSYGLKGLKAGATKLAQKLSGQGKTTGKEGIRSFKPGKNLTTKRNIQDKVVKAVDEGTKEALGSTGKLTEKGITRASRWKRKESKRLKEFSYEYDRIVAKKKKK